MASDNTNVSENPIVTIKRKIYTQADIRHSYGREDDATKSTCETLKSFVANYVKGLPRAFLKTFSIFEVLRSYRVREYIASDVISGVSAACLHFPQGLAFGLLSSLAPAYGLYSSFFPVLLYMLFGTSPHVSFGTNAVIALSTAELVDTAAAKEFSDEIVIQNATEFQQSTGDQDILYYKVSIAAGASFLCGLILLCMSLFRLGFITSYLSTSFIGGFTTAAAFHIFTSQVPKAFGIMTPLRKGIGKLVRSYIDIFTNIGKTNIGSLVTSLITAVVLIFVKDFINEKFKHKLKLPIPIDLVVIIVATVISHFGHLSSQFGIQCVGTIPSGFPMPEIPRLTPVDIILPKAFEIAILVFFLTIAMAKLCATKHGYEVDDNQELFAYGISNFVSSFFHCFPSCTAPPRTMLLSLMGAKSTLNALFSAVILLLIILVLGQLFNSLPVPVLAVMVMVAVKKLLAQVLGLPKLYQQSKYDFIIWTVTCSTAVLLDLVYGLVFGVIVSLYVVVVQSQLQQEAYLSKPRSEDIFVDTSEYAVLDPVQDIGIVRPSCSLYFATAELFRKRLYKKLLNPITTKQTTKGKGSRDIRDDGDDEEAAIADVPQTDAAMRILIIDCQRVNCVDIKGISILKAICSDYMKISIDVFLCSCSRSMRQSLEHSDFYETLPRQNMFFAVEDAFEAATLALRKLPSS